MFKAFVFKVLRNSKVQMLIMNFSRTRNAKNMNRWPVQHLLKQCLNVPNFLEEGSTSGSNRNVKCSTKTVESKSSLCVLFLFQGLEMENGIRSCHPHVARGCIEEVIYIFYSVKSCFRWISNEA